MMPVRRMIDLSQELYHNCPVHPNHEPPSMDFLFNAPKDGWKLERITMNLHTATHMDAPSHLGDFKLNMDQIPVERFQGQLLYIPLGRGAGEGSEVSRGKGPGEPITVEDLIPYSDRMDDNTIVFLYTGWGEKRDWSREWIYESPYLSNDAASLLAEKSVRGVGIDHFSVGGTGAENEQTHRILLGANIWVAEGLQLDFPELQEGDWHVFALPVKIRDASGGPARVVAVQYGATS